METKTKRTSEINWRLGLLLGAVKRHRDGPLKRHRIDPLKLLQKSLLSSLYSITVTHDRNWYTVM